PAEARALIRICLLPSPVRTQRTQQRYEPPAGGPPKRWLFYFPPIHTQKRRGRPLKERTVTAEEVIIAIKKATEELGRVPSLEEVLRATQISRHAIRRNFISYREALAACGLERRGTYRLPLKLLFVDWAEVVRKLGRIPTVSEYEVHAKHSHGPLIRIYRGW